MDLMFITAGPIVYGFLFLVAHYSISLPSGLIMQTSLDLLSLADRYNFTQLHSALEGCLCEEVSISNVLQLMFYADTYNAHRLHRHCSSLIDSDAEAVLSSKSMRDLPKEYMKLLLSRWGHCACKSWGV